ncbi:multi-sensor signal transduction histidine kinase [Calothrix sp. NIES-4071]|nr:multi-sensor signal transduction histidine kinase [Calothrix sp. NIES-4071]BAZ59960.1 multi-sensor signal transduction histidine kinase [Calothrix sp. NIES-4105]
MTDNRTLLIVDDCTEDRKVYRRYLLKDPDFNYEIVEADSAETGLTLWQQMQFDVVLLDFCLPEMSGFEFFQLLASKGFNNRPCVIMLTGHGDEGLAVQAMKLGVHDYLVKNNLKSDVLQLAVRNAIKQSHLQAQLNKTLEQQRLIATTALNIRKSLDLDQILYTAVVEVQRLLRCGVAVYQFSDDFCADNITQLMASSTLPRAQLFGNCHQVENEGEYHWQCEGLINNIYATGLKHPQSLVQECYKEGNLVIPINLSHESKLWGLLVAHHNSDERLWQPDEVEILRELALQLAIAIQQAQQLQETQASLVKEKQLSRFKSQFLGTVSHEYRTPLASILAAASTLHKYGDKLEVPKQQRFLEIIEQKARQMSKLVDDMLLVNQIELDRTKFKSAPLDLMHFFSDLMEQQRLVVGDSHELIFKVTGSSESFWGDKVLLRQLFTNLISNAIKYSPDGGNIEFHLINKETEIILHVKDEGVGISSKELDKLFQPITCTSNIDTIPGAGLGLVIAKACVELHGGTITFDSHPNQGTVVTVHLPKSRN